MATRMKVKHSSAKMRKFDKLANKKIKMAAMRHMRLSKASNKR